MMKTLPIVKKKAKHPKKKGGNTRNIMEGPMSKKTNEDNDPPKRGDAKWNIKSHVYYMGTAM